MEVKGKYVVGFDTICNGNQTSVDEEGNIILFDNKDEAFKDLFSDAIAGLEGTDNDYFQDNNLDREKVLSEMQDILEKGDVNKMRNYLSQNPDCNYHGDFVESADTFILGRKTIFTEKGIKIEGKSLEDL